MSDSKVQNLHLPRRRQHYVFRLYIAVENPGPVSSDKGASTLLGNGEEFVHMERLIEPSAQGLPLDVFHNDKEFIAVFDHVVNSRDVGIVELRGELRFVPQASSGTLVSTSCPRNALQRDRAFQADVLCKVNLAHAALSQPLADNEPAHSCTGEVGGGPFGRVGLYARLGH